MRIFLKREITSNLNELPEGTIFKKYIYTYTSINKSHCCTPETYTVFKTDYTSTKKQEQSPTLKTTTKKNKEHILVLHKNQPYVIQKSLSIVFLRPHFLFLS